MKQINHIKLFWLDAGGALLTAIMHGFVLTRFTEYIGVPDTILTKLAVIAAVFAIYSASCALLKHKNWRTLLKIIAFANLCFCFATIAMMINYRSEITTLGVAYFIIEIIIIVVLVNVELKVAKQPALN